MLIDRPIANIILLILTLFLEVFKKTEYKAIPCVIVLVDGEITYAGSPREEFEKALDDSLVKVNEVKEA